MVISYKMSNIYRLLVFATRWLTRVGLPLYRNSIFKYIVASRLCAVKRALSKCHAHTQKYEKRLQITKKYLLRNASPTSIPIKTTTLHRRLGIFHSLYPQITLLRYNGLRRAEIVSDTHMLIIYIWKIELKQKQKYVE